jgi:hypothetical protein
MVLTNTALGYEFEVHKRQVSSYHSSTLLEYVSNTCVVSTHLYFNRYMIRWLSRYSYGLDGHGSIRGRGKIVSGAHLATFPIGTGDLPPEVKRQGREADHSPPSSAEVKNGGAIPPLPHMFSWHSA